MTPRDSLPEQWEFWIDRGGTFNDIVGLADGRHLHVQKYLSEAPGQYEDAAIHGIAQILDVPDGSIPTERVSALRMGTTLATNTLLEREGEPCALVTTTGFRDVLRIGYQSPPELFDLAIHKPELLYRRVVEIDERLTAEGEALRAPDPDLVREQLTELVDTGIDAVAIVLMHSYRYPEHESLVAELAREAGISQVSVSHEASALIKIVGRWDTTVVDAYLSRILRRYVGRVAARIPGVNLIFMQSNGGLAVLTTDVRYGGSAWNR